MSSVFRRRIPWGQAGAAVEEGIELEELGGEALQVAEVTSSTGGRLNPVVAGISGEIDTVKNIASESESIAQKVTGTDLGWKDIFDSAKGVFLGGKPKGKGLKKNPKEKGKGLKKVKEQRAKEDSKSFDYTETKENDPNDFKLLDGLNPPPFKYLGPGNSLNKGKPYNQIDADAKEHDIAYANAKENESIHQADDKFIKKASDHLIEGLSGKGSVSDTVGAIVGGLGIGAKRLIESKSGVIYPSISGNYNVYSSEKTYETRIYRSKASKSCIFCGSTSTKNSSWQFTRLIRTYTGTLQQSRLSSTFI